MSKVVIVGGPGRLVTSPVRRHFATRWRWLQQTKRFERLHHRYSMTRRSARSLGRHSVFEFEHVLNSVTAQDATEIHVRRVVEHDHV